MLPMKTNLELAISEILAPPDTTPPANDATLDPEHPLLAPTTSVTTSNDLEIPMSKIICAYIRIAGFTSSPGSAIPSFERALEKHPDSTEFAGRDATTPEGRWAQLVERVRKQYWKEALEKSEKTDGCLAKRRGMVSCPCCGLLAKGDVIRRNLGMGEEPAEECSNGLKKSRPKTKKRRSGTRRVQSRKKANEAASVAFDPYGPSTSKASL